MISSPYLLCVSVLSHTPEVLRQSFDGVTVKDFAAVFCHKDQMNMHCKDTMPALPNVFILCHGSTWS